MARISEQVEWLSLIERSGPFVVPAVLEEIYPQGLEKIETPRRQRLRAAYDEWRDAVDEDDPDVLKLHDVWVRMVLQEALEYEGEVLVPRARLDGKIVYRAPEQGAEITPDFAVRADGGEARLLIAVYPPETDLQKSLRGDRWTASPTERMTHLCRVSGVRVGLVTNGEEWMLVNAPIGSTSGQASWFARLWWLEPVTFKAFVSLLGVRRCFGPADESLGRLLERSIAFQEEVTDTLGEQVRRAVEVLIQALGRADQDRNGELLKDVRPAELYEAGLTVMMRLVFILCAEERGLMVLGDPVYDQHYAISTLRSGLREDESHHGPEVLERRHDAWSRMLAVFRAVYGGVGHETLRMPALGGSLFDPDRFPFLEGRKKGTSWQEEPAFPLPIDNRTVLLLLTALQVLEQRGGAQLLSYRALDVEQIGHVYEGLLEYTVAKLPKTTVGLIGSQKVRHPSIGLDELEPLLATDTESAAKHLADVTGRSKTAIRNSMERGGDDAALIELIQACGGDEALARRLLPFAELIRKDSWGSRLIYRVGSFAVTPGIDRRETGTHYTPRSLTESIVEKTLEPIVHVGPADGKPREEWRLKSPAELLGLKVCDPAMGSGAFLVQVCRYLAERLVEAWAREEDARRVVTIDGVVLDSANGEEPLPENLDERLLFAKRLVAERCLYGVDLNPMAVELAKLSIWLVTLAKGRPFGFLDHNLRCGDSLLGIHRLEQLTMLKMNPDDGPYQMRIFGQSIEGAVGQAIELRRRLREVPIRDIRDVKAMAYLDEESRKLLEGPSLIANAFIGEMLRSRGRADEIEAAADSVAIRADRIYRGDGDARRVLKPEAIKTLSVDLPIGRLPRKTFHFPLEFPEVFQRENGGFDSIVGNPPFMGGKRIRSAYGQAYREYLVLWLADGNKGSADLVAYFYLRAFYLLRQGGDFGLLAVNTIAEGDTRQVGLERLVGEKHAVIYAAYPNEPWPGRAAVITSRVHVRKGEWKSKAILSGREVPFISAFLSDQEEWTPKRLKDNTGKAFIGSYVLGMGFTLSEEEALAMIQRDPKNRDVLFPYLNGKDLNSHPEQRPSRWVINFWDWPEEKAKEYEEPYQIVLEKVKPERQRSKPNGQYQLRKPLPQRWWQYADKRPALYHTIGRGHAFLNHPEDWDPKMKMMDHVLVTTRVSKTGAFILVENCNVFSDATVVFTMGGYSLFALMQSSIHVAYAWKHSSQLKTDMRYTPSDIFETFPFPLKEDRSALQHLGERYHSLRAEIMRGECIGLTKLYNRFHDPDDSDLRFQELRDMHRQIDKAVAAAYGWGDLDLIHGFHEVDYLPANDCVRFTISEQARLEILRRLARLNKERYEEEVRKGLHGGKGADRPRRAVRRTAPSPKVVPLFPPETYTAVDDSRADRPMAAEPQATYGTISRANRSDEDHARAILAFLRADPGWHAKRDILNATGIPATQWMPLIDGLLAEGKIVRRGQRRGTRYSISKTKGEAHDG